MRRAVALALLAAAQFALAGCHDEARLRQRLEGPPTRLPVEPDEPSVPPVPALLDTVQAWKPPTSCCSRAEVAEWNIVTTSAGDDFEITYRVPATWSEQDDSGTTRNLDRTISAKARRTELDDSELSLATYAAQLAGANPLYQYSTTDGHVVYLTRRDVDLVPSDPDAPGQVFHTAVMSVDGRIAKLDVRYDEEYDWRWGELADAITGTLQVRRIAN